MHHEPYFVELPDHFDYCILRICLGVFIKVTLLDRYQYDGLVQGISNASTLETVLL